MKTYYHNVTKGIINETEIVDVAFDLDEGDKLYKTEAGSAELFEVTEQEKKEIRRRMSDHFNTDK